MNTVIKKTVSLIAALAVAGGGAVLPAAAEHTAAKNSENVRVTAFRGAEGGGMYTSGARGALDEGERIEVYHVTNLNDSGEGSFRDAVSKGNRIVVFDVSGYIDLASNLTIGHDNMTVLGQTAPGDGICFKGDNIKIGADNVIMRYIRFRVGASSHILDAHRAPDGLEITDDRQNVILDHCSVSWGMDENLSAYAVKDVTIQNCIIAEALNQSGHEKGEHGYAAIWGGVNLSVHHNIIATHKSRNPKIGTSETVAMTHGYTDDKTLVDIKNNIFYNWSDKAGYGSENGAKTYLVNNIYKPGPATGADSGSDEIKTAKRSRIFELSAGNKYKENYIGSVYAKGNFVDQEPDDPDYENALRVNEDNWQDDLHTGVYVDTKVYASADKSAMRIETPDEQYTEYESEYPIELDDTNEVYEKVLAQAGANLPKRDLVDERIIENVRTRTAPNGAKGSKGLVDNTEDGVPEGQEELYDGEGYPIWSSETRSADYDTDGDGIPDEWEVKMGLNPENPTDSTLLGAEGRTFLEMYVDIASGAAEQNITVTANDSGDVYVTGRSGDTVSLYVDGSPYTDLTLEKTDGYPAGSSLITAVYTADGELVSVKTATYTGGELHYPDAEVPQGCSVKHFIWNSMEKMQPVSDGSAGAAHVNINAAGTHTVTAVSKTDGGFSNNAYIINQSDIFMLSHEDSDFTLVLELKNIPTITKNAYGMIRMNTGSGEPVYIGAGCNDKYEQTVFYTGGTMPLSDIKYLKAERVGDKINLYSGKSLLGWTLIDSYDAAGSVTITGAYQTPDGERYAAEMSGRIIKETTEPQISIENVAENQRLGFNEHINVSVTPDSAPVQLISISLNGKEIASANVNISAAETVQIPVSFADINAGVLTVSCVDANLCTASDSVNITVSADLSPWQIADIGAGENEAKTYVSVTSDYTYKINSPDGIIGGAADKCGYVYQRFTGDSRIYFRSRMQGASQFGIMLRSSADAAAQTYWFGGGYNDEGTLQYTLGHRPEGGEMTIDYTLDNSQPNLYFIAEKTGDTLNIYQTENGATVYKTKTLLTSIDVSALGSEYYMGFAAAGGSGNPADAGWVAVESLDGDTVSWNFDYGLDWLWQMQERNVLAPSWTNETAGGNFTGRMVIETDDEYSSERYIYREYLAGEGNKVISASADVMLSGDTAGLNIYLNDGAPDKGFKVSFGSDGLLYAGNTASEYVFEKNKWYTVELVCDMGIDPDAAHITVRDSEGNECTDIEACEITAMRPQKDTKKTEITNAVFFEPVKGTSAVYSVDNVNVTVTDSSIQKNVIESRMWNFGSGEEFAGLTSLGNGAVYAGLNVIGGGTVESGRNKTIDGILFPSRYKMGGPGNTSSKCVWFDIPDGTTDITVYGEPAGSSNVRSAIINIGGTEVQKTVLTTQMSVSYTYTGDASRVYIYGDAGINLYGISYETYTYSG